jgi:hypothetical protein
VPLPTTASFNSPIGEVRRGYVDSWNLIYERRLPWDMSISAGYVGTKTVDQMGFENINASSVGMGQPGQLLFPQWGRTAGHSQFNGWLRANYHSLQVALNKPFSRGLFVKAAYTWSKAMNRTDDEGWSSVNWNEPAYQFKNYGWAGYDRTHMLVLGFVWEMPFGREGSGALNAIIKDWALNAGFGALSGTPFRVSASGASVNSPGNAQSADRVGEINQLGGIGSASPYYDPSAWAPVTEVRYGNEGRNSIRGPGAVNINAGLVRRFPIGSKVNFEFSVQAFNLTNTPHFNNPDGDVNSGGFMTITSTSANSPERQIRIGGSIRF